MCQDDAAEFAVGDALQAQLLLHLHDAANRVVLGLAQVGGAQAPGLVLRACVRELRRAQQAADMVGAEWWLCQWHRDFTSRVIGVVVRARAACGNTAAPAPRSEFGSRRSRDGGEEFAVLQFDAVERHVHLRDVDGGVLAVDELVVPRDVGAVVADVAEERAQRPVVVEGQRQRADRAVRRLQLDRHVHGDAELADGQAPAPRSRARSRSASGSGTGRRCARRDATAGDRSRSAAGPAH